MKLCKDCKNCIGISKCAKVYWCPATGDDIKATCCVARGNENYCGADAKYFEPIEVVKAITEKKGMINNNPSAIIDRLHELEEERSRLREMICLSTYSLIHNEDIDLTPFIKIMREVNPELW